MAGGHEFKTHRVQRTCAVDLVLRHEDTPRRMIVSQLSGVNLTLPCSSDPHGQLFTSVPTCHIRILCVPNHVCSARSPKRYLSISVRQLRLTLRHIGTAGVAVGVLFRRRPRLTAAAWFEVRGPSTVASQRGRRKRRSGPVNPAHRLKGGDQDLSASQRETAGCELETAHSDLRSQPRKRLG